MTSFLTEVPVSETGEKKEHEESNTERKYGDTNIGQTASFHCRGRDHRHSHASRDASKPKTGASCVVQAMLRGYTGPDLRDKIRTGLLAMSHQMCIYTSSRVKQLRCSK